MKATNPHSADEAPRFEDAQVAACLNGWDERHDPPKHMVVYAIQERAVCENPAAGPDGKGWRDDGVAYTLEARNTAQAVVGALTAAHGPNGHGGSGLATDKGAEAGHILAVKAYGGMNTAGAIDVATALNVGNGGSRFDFDSETFLSDGWSVRRLTPTECERLQGFRDGYTDVPKGNKPMADGPRYNMLGDSMAVPVMAWIADALDAAVLA